MTDHAERVFLAKQERKEKITTKDPLEGMHMQMKRGVRKASGTTGNGQMECK